MNKLDKLFNVECIYIIWYDFLENKSCFCANDIKTLKENVIYNMCGGLVQYNDDIKPFKMNEKEYIFCYYDPNYETNRKFLLGDNL